MTYERRKVGIQIGCFLFCFLIAFPCLYIGVEQYQILAKITGLLESKSYSILNYTASTGECNPPPVQHGPIPWNQSQDQSAENLPIPTLNYIFYYTYAYNFSDTLQHSNICDISSNSIVFNCTNIGIQSKYDSNDHGGPSTCFRLLDSNLNAYNKTILMVEHTLYVNRDDPLLIFTSDPRVFGTRKIIVGSIFGFISLIFLFWLLYDVGYNCYWWVSNQCYREPNQSYTRIN